MTAEGFERRSRRTADTAEATGDRKLEKPDTIQWLSPSFDMYMNGMPSGLSSMDKFQVLKNAQKELAGFSNGEDIYAEALAKFRAEEGREVGEFPAEMKEFFAKGTYVLRAEDVRTQRCDDEASIAYSMAHIVKQRFDPRDPAYLSKYFDRSNQQREAFVENTRGASTETWKEYYKGLKQSEPPHEGILRDHPYFERLSQEMALDYLRNHSGGFHRFYNGEVSPDGYLIEEDGEESLKRPYDVLDTKDRAKLHAAIAEKLSRLEGFIDITDDENRQHALAIFPVRRA